jgi:Mn2+/Fe2+ NRAMP family transporter
VHSSDLLRLIAIRMLFWAAVINGFVAVPVMIAMMIMVARQTLMGRYVATPLLSIAGWASTALMAIAALFLVSSIFLSIEIAYSGSDQPLAMRERAIFVRLHFNET